MFSGPIFLTGFMATGKSRVGKAVAGRLRRRFVDTDSLIEERAGKPIAQIFADEGEAAFRDLEHECVRQAAGQAPSVVALGGGAIAHERNCAAIREAGGVLVCLEADVDTILERVCRRETRPLLAGLSRAEKRQEIGRLLAERAPHYAKADFAVSSSEEATVQQTAARLIDALEEWHAPR